MASLDAARRELAVKRTGDDGESLPSGAVCTGGTEKIPGVRVLDGTGTGTPAMFDKDMTRLVFSAIDLGITGYRLGNCFMNVSGSALN